MNWLKPHIEKIKTLTQEGSPASLTYAALEVRLAVEHICYERLRSAHKYISADDLRAWQPGYVIQTVMKMVDPQVAAEWTLSMSSEPVKDTGEWEEPKEWVKVGTQKGFDVKTVNKIWQAMGSFLHIERPRSHDHALAHYSPVEKMRPKIEEALKELERIAEGTLIGTSVPRPVSFTCECGQLNSRATPMLN